jgi:hypothetical protein
VQCLWGVFMLAIIGVRVYAIYASSMLQMKEGNLMFKKCSIIVMLAVTVVITSGWFGCSKKNPTEETPSTQAPVAPVLASPTNGAIGIATNPTLLWSASSGGATSYTLQVSADSLFGSFIYNQSGLTGFSQALNGLDTVTVYYWRVSATNSYGASGWSSVWQFTTATGPGTGITWVSIPAGNFTMGSLPTDPHANTDEQPQHTVYLDAYQIGKYEVTNSQYKAFMDVGGYTNSAYWTTDGWTWRTNNNITEPYYWTSGSYNSGSAFPNHPVNGVSWYEAVAFCQWAGGYLPTEAPPTTGPGVLPGSTENATVVVLISIPLPTVPRWSFFLPEPAITVFTTWPGMFGSGLTTGMEARIIAILAQIPIPPDRPRVRPGSGAAAATPAPTTNAAAALSSATPTPRTAGMPTLVSVSQSKILTEKESRASLPGLSSTPHLLPI